MQGRSSLAAFAAPADGLLACGVGRAVGCLLFSEIFVLSEDLRFDSVCSRADCAGELGWELALHCVPRVGPPRRRRAARSHAGSDAVSPYGTSLLFSLA